MRVTSSAGSGTMPNAKARTDTPTKIVPSRSPIAVIVFAAFRASGGLKAGTPFVIASVPLSATEPKAKARTMRITDRASNPPSGGTTLRDRERRGRVAGRRSGRCRSR